MLLKIFTHPQPVMAVSTGHTIAAGGFMLLAGDTRLGADGDFKIGMTLLEFGLMFARERVSNRHFTNAAIQTHLFTPREAVDTGFLDCVCPPDDVVAEAVAAARRLAALNPLPYTRTKQRARGALADRILNGLDNDISGVMA